MNDNKKRTVSYLYLQYRRITPSACPFGLLEKLKSQKQKLVVKVRNEFLLQCK